jgi:hypothetical protein
MRDKDEPPTRQVAASVPPGPDLDSIARERSSKLSGSARPVARGDVQATRAEGQ